MVSKNKADLSICEKGCVQSDDVCESSRSPRKLDLSRSRILLCRRRFPESAAQFSTRFVRRHDARHHGVARRGRLGEASPLPFRLGLLFAFDIADDRRQFIMRQILWGHGRVVVLVPRQVKSCLEARDVKLGRERERETHPDFAKPVHDGEVNVFRAGLDDFEQRFDGELDHLVARHVGFPVLFQELADRLARPADRVGLRRGTHVSMWCLTFIILRGR